MSHPGRLSGRAVPGFAILACQVARPGGYLVTIGQVVRLGELSVTIGQVARPGGLPGCMNLARPRLENSDLGFALFLDALRKIRKATAASPSTSYVRGMLEGAGAEGARLVLMFATQVLGT